VNAIKNEKIAMIEKITSGKSRLGIDWVLLELKMLKFRFVI